MTPDLLDHRYAPQGIGQLIAEPRPAFADVIDPAFFSKDVDNRQSHRARQRRPVPRVAQGEGSRSGGDRVINVRPAQQGTNGRVAGAQPLGDGDDVGNHRNTLGCKPVARSAHPGHDLVERDQETVPLAALRQAPPEEVGRRVGRQRRSTDGLTEIQRDRLWSRGFQGAVKRVERLLPGGIEAPGARRDMRVARQVRFEWPLQSRPAGQGQGRHRRSVIGLCG